jgi:hypothetical protein
METNARCEKREYSARIQRRKCSETVILQLKQISRIIEGERLPAQRHWLEN